FVWRPARHPWRRTSIRTSRRETSATRAYRTRSQQRLDVPEPGRRISQSDRSYSEVSYLLQEACKIPASFLERVTPNLFQKRLRQHQSHHGFPDHSRRRHNTHVGALISRKGWLASQQIHRFKWPA